MTRIEAARMLGQSGRIEPVFEENDGETIELLALLESWTDDLKHTPFWKEWLAENGVYRR